MVLTRTQRTASNAAVASTVAALTTLVPVAAHQLGLCRHLPDPPLALFDSDRITQSKAAHPLGVPDGLLGLASYSVTLALLMAARRTRTVHPLLKIKLALDASAATGNAVRQVVEFHRLCSWCTATALATVAVVHYGRKSIE
jgi:uncharacterized membrane protein